MTGLTKIELRYRKTLRLPLVKWRTPRKLKENIFTKVRRTMRDCVRKLLQDERKRSRGEYSKNKPGKPGLNTW